MASFSGAKSEKGNVLILAKEPEVRERAATYLKELGYGGIAVYSSAEGALKVFRAVIFDAVLTGYDLGKGEKNGVEFLRAVSEERSPFPRFILVHKWPVIDLKIGSQVARLVAWPFTAADLERALR